MVSIEGVKGGIVKKTSLAAPLQAMLGDAFSILPLTPNQITVLAVLFAFIGFFFLVARSFWIGFGLFILSALCDVIDGAVARKRGIVSSKGAFLDGVTDRIVEFFLIAGLMLYSWPPYLVTVFPGYLWLATLLFFGTSLTSYIPAYAHLKGLTEKEDSPGIFARTERVSLLLAVILCLALNQVAIAVILVIFGALLSIGTASTRFIYFWVKK